MVKSTAQVVRTPFDVKRSIFRELFQLDTTSNKVRLNNIERVLERYSKFLSNDQLPARIMAVHLIKTYEKLVHGLKAQSLELPRMLPLKVAMHQIVLLTIDLIAISRNKTTFVILVSPEQWTPEDISNKFENYLIARVLWPELYEVHPYEICYYCPDNGKSCLLPASVVTAFNLNFTKKRIMRIFEAVSKRHYFKIPVGIRCHACPVYDKCLPNGFIKTTFSEKVQTIEAPLNL